MDTERGERLPWQPPGVNPASSGPAMTPGAGGAWRRQGALRRRPLAAGAGEDAIALL